MDTSPASITTSLPLDGPLILDGGLATELETTYHKDLSSNLWSAEILFQDPRAIFNVHLDYFRAGADVVSTVSYQASTMGFLKAGFTLKQAHELMRKSVDLAVEARDVFWAEYTANHQEHHAYDSRRKPLVALSLGAFGATLADGSEFTGDYGSTVTYSHLVDFHRERLQVFRKDFNRVDLLAFETIPSLDEARAICEALQSNLDDSNDNIITTSDSTSTSADTTQLVAPTKIPPTWISFSCSDESHVSHGELLSECVRHCAKVDSVWGIGINCMKPRFIELLIRTIRSTLDQVGSTKKWVVCYPNVGHDWDNVKKDWNYNTGVSINEFTDYAEKWVDAVGPARILLGGCCKTTPEHVKSIRERVLGKL